MWDEGIEMARTAYALDEALESGDTGRIIELADLLSGQVKQEVSTRAEEEGWYEEYDRATSHEHWKVDTTVDPYGPVAFPMRAVPASTENWRGLLEPVYGSGIYDEIEDRALQRLRRQAGFRTAADFANAANIPVKDYQRYERGAADAIPPQVAGTIARQLASSGVTVPEWLSAAADTGKTNPYARSFKQMLEDEGWRVLEGASGDVFTLTYEPTFPGVEPEFTVPLDMRGKGLNDPKAWISAARDAAASDMVFWAGGVRKDEPGWVAEEIKRFKEGALAELPQLVEDAMTELGLDDEMDGVNLDRDAEDAPLAAYPMTDLLREAYEASRSLGMYPTDAQLERYDTAMLEIERRIDESRVSAPSDGLSTYEECEHDLGADIRELSAAVRCAETNRPETAAVREM